MISAPNLTPAFVVWTAMLGDVALAVKLPPREDEVGYTTTVVELKLELEADVLLVVGAA